MTATERRFVNAALTCIYGCASEDLPSGFAGLPDAVAIRLGHLITGKLAAHAKITGDWSFWAHVQHHLPRAGWREAGATLRQRLRVWEAPAPLRPADDGARRLRRLACDLIRAGVPGRQLLHQLDEANGTLPDPVSAERVGSIAVWAAGVVKGAAHAR